MATKGTRKGHGEGTIYQREDGFWIGQMELSRDITGKRQRKTFSAKTQKELVAKMKEYQYKQSRGELPKTNTVTLGSWIVTWLENYKKPNLRQTTYENYENMIRNHIVDSELSKIPIQKITTDHIQNFLKVKSESGKLSTLFREDIISSDGKPKSKAKETQRPLSARTINLLHFIIKHALEQARKNNIVANNVAENCQKFKDEKKEVKPLSQEEVARLLDTVKNHRLYPALVLELSTGIRRGELQALRWDNVNLEAGTITINENLVRVKGGLKVHNPKTKSSIRTILIPDKVRELMVEYKRRQEENKKPSYKDLGIVFCKQDGDYIKPRSFQRMFTNWIVKAGLPEETRFHDLRHTFITNLIGVARVDIRTAQSITGHADTKTLINTYSHVVTEAQRRAAEKMGDLIPDV